MNDSIPSMMVLAGEASGDMHGAHLVAALKKRIPDLQVFGMGGSAMTGQGVEIVVEAAAMSVVGITEVVSKLPVLWGGLKTIKSHLSRRRPDLLVCIDFPDFNLMAAKHAKALGIPVLYYVSPQVWAWRKGRVRTISKRVDHMAVILPFETEIYKNHGVPVTFVGHPLMDTVGSFKIARPMTEIDRGPRIGLLPGSRDREVTRLLPELLGAADRIRQRIPGARFFLSHAPSVARQHIEIAMAGRSGEAPIEIARCPVHDLFDRCDLLVAASGTVTLEAALVGVPTIIVYKISPTSYWLGRRLVQVKHIGLVNLIGDEPCVPELIQSEASAPSIAETACGLLADPAAMAAMTEAMADVRRRLGGAGAAERTAEIAQSLINGSSTAAAEGSS